MGDSLASVSKSFKTKPVGVRKGHAQVHTLRKTATPKRGKGPSVYTVMFLAAPLDRISVVRKGVTPDTLVFISEEMGISKEKIFTLLHLSRATVNRRIKTHEPLPTDYSERVIGLQKLIGQVEVMVCESGDPVGFNAAHWVAQWLEQPSPALNNAKPGDFMDTIEGQKLVASILAKMQSGAYA